MINQAISCGCLNYIGTEKAALECPLRTLSWTALLTWTTISFKLSKFTDKIIINKFLHLVASLFHTDFSYSTPLLLPWARFFHLPLKPKSKGNKTQSQKQHKGQDTNYYPAWKYLHNLCVASAGNGKFISNP